MKALNRDDILKARDTQRIEVEVSEWGGSVFVAPLSVKARDSMLGDLQKTDENDVSTLKMLLFVNCVQDKGGNLLFSKKDIPVLEKKSATSIDKIFNAAEKLAAVTEGSLGK